MRKIPGPLWISIASLGAITLIQLLIGLQHGSGRLLLAIVLNVALLSGLLLGHKWAYVGIIIFAIFGLIAALGSNVGSAIGVFIGNGIVVVPMIISTRFFFPPHSNNMDAEKPETEQV